MLVRYLLGENLKGQDHQCIPSENGCGLVEGDVDRRPAAPLFVVVHAGQVVQDQRRGVNHLDGAGQRQRVVTRSPDEVGAGQHENDGAVGVIGDLQGPKIRTGILAGGEPVRLESGRVLEIGSCTGQHVVHFAPAFFPKSHKKFHFHVVLKAEQKGDLIDFLKEVDLPEMARVDVGPVSLL